MPEVFDSVHGNILLSEIEAKIVSTLTFQRLQFVRQFGIPDTRFFTANHTRFSHSLGTLYVMDRFLKDGHGDIQDLSEDSKQKLRLAALLHDIGHPPGSHVLEAAIVNLGGRTHVDCGKSVIMTFLSDVLNQYSAAEISKMISGHFKSASIPGVFSSLISSAIDADRLDYLTRDIYFTGVDTPEISIDSIIRHVSFRDNKIIFTGKLAIISRFLKTRLAMYSNVYLEPKHFGLASVYQYLFSGAVTAGNLEMPDAVIAKGQEDKWFQYNDNLAFNTLLSTKCAAKLKNGAFRFLRGIPPYEIFGIAGVFDLNTAPTKYTIINAIGNSSNLQRSLAEKLGIPTSNLYVRAANPHKIADESYLYVEKGGQQVPIIEASPTLLALKNKGLFIARIYSYDDIPQPAVSKAIKSLV